MPTTWQDFLAENAMFPFPNTIQSASASSADISEVDVGLLDRDWKVAYAMPDETLLQKLCQTLNDALGDDLVPETSEGPLRLLFGRHLEFSTVSPGTTKSKRLMNHGEPRVRNFELRLSSPV
jgi:hypothetical protein